MNYKAIDETFKKRFGTGKLMYVVPIDMDESNLIAMQICKELCICWILLEEGKIALDQLISDIGITKAIIQTTADFHDMCSDRIIRMYRLVGKDEKLVDQMLYDMDDFIRETISDHYDRLIIN